MADPWNEQQPRQAPQQNFPLYDPTYAPAPGQQPPSEPYFQQQPGFPMAPYPQPNYYQAGYQAPPENHLVWAILSTIFCFMPLGIASIVYSAQVNSKWSMGDFYGARESAKKALNFAKWAAITAGILYAVVILCYVVFFIFILGAIAYF
ncbi:MAG: CD225/dispanin family protein [Propionibacteriaceae bacterium]|jgi:hypothetical protein|nr:CD225/dispanin family protein [Propionibacteriaceae bacterium]